MYRTGNWPASKGERGTAEVVKKNSQPEETMICNYLRVSVQFSADMKNRMEEGRQNCLQRKPVTKGWNVLGFFFSEAVVMWDDFLTRINGWRTGRTERKGTRKFLIR